MSCVLVQAGQCGNQLGYAILEKLFSHFDDEKLSTSKSNTDKQKEIFFRYQDNKKTQIKYIARAVCFDTEPKVINECVRKANINQNWAYDNKSLSYLHGGAGNNWAQGYEMCCSDDFLIKSIDCVRRELEYCDYSPFLLISQSLAGGTGSGLGTKITEALSVEFPEVLKINLAIVPYSSFNEIIVQYYNAILSISKLTTTSVSDGVILYENEIAQYLCKNIFGIERPTMHDINNMIASHIVPTLLPKFNADALYSDDNDKLSYNRSNNHSHTLLSDDVRYLCQNPSYKLLDIKYVPQTFQKSIDYTYDTWPALMNSINRMQGKGSFTERGLSTTHGVGVDSIRGHDYSVRTLASVLTFHGIDATDALANIKISPTSSFPSSSIMSTTTTGRHESKSDRDKNMHRTKIFSNTHDQVMNNHMSMTAGIGTGGSSCLQYTPLHCQNLLYLPESTVAQYTADHPPPSALPPLTAVNAYATSYKQVNGYQRSISLLSNNNSVVPFLERIHLRASELFHNKAYLHQYKTYGVEENDFLESFQQVGQIIHNYQSL